MGKCAEVSAYSCRGPCRCEGVTILGNQCWGKVREGIRSELFVPPFELIRLVIAHMSAFMGQDFLRVAVESFGKGVAGRLRAGEVAAFADTPFNHLCPAFS